VAKKIVGYVKLQVPAGKANPSPPIGPALGQRGLNIMEFCKAFNAQTQGLEPGLPVPVVITAYADKASFIMRPARDGPYQEGWVCKGAQAAYRQGRQDHPRTGGGHRQGQNARSNCRESGIRCANHRRQRAQYGHYRGRDLIMAKLSKRVRAIRAAIDRTKAYPVGNALELVKKTATAKFDESVDVAINLGIDAEMTTRTRLCGAASGYRQNCAGCGIYSRATLKRPRRPAPISWASVWLKDQRRIYGIRRRRSFPGRYAHRWAARPNPCPRGLMPNRRSGS
jgi:hypothetical protein